MGNLKIVIKSVAEQSFYISIPGLQRSQSPVFIAI